MANTALLSWNELKEIIKPQTVAPVLAICNLNSGYKITQNYKIQLEYFIIEV